MNTLETLKAARALISKPEHWNKHALAKDRAGFPAMPLDESACSWCALGALTKVGDDSMESYMLLRNQINDGLGEFNDTHTHEEVLDLFDSVIAKLEAEIKP